MGFLARLRRRGKGKVDIDALAAKAAQFGIDPQMVREILESSRGTDGKIDWNAAAAKAQARGLDVSRLRGLMR